MKIAITIVIAWMIAVFAALQISGADEKELPPLALKDGQITVKLKNGQMGTFNENDYKVVPRVKHAKAVVPSPEASPKVQIQEVKTFQKNHVRVLGGVGPTGVGLDRTASSETLTRNNKAVFGVSYGRNVCEKWSVEGEGLTNGTALLGVGFHW